MKKRLMLRLMLFGLIFILLFVFSCAPKPEESVPVIEKEQVIKGEDDFGCFYSCKFFPEGFPRQMCEDWKAGKEVQWPLDCKVMVTESCIKLCEKEKAETSSKSSQYDQEILSKLEAHQMPELLTIEFEEGVKPADEEDIRQGYKIADFYLNEWFGHSITRKSAVIVENTAEDSGWIDEGERLAFYYQINDDEWKLIEEASKKYNMNINRRGAAHEYIHMYQFNNGCVNQRREGEKATWIVEGAAELLSYMAFKDSGNLPDYFNYVTIEELHLKIIEQQETGGLIHPKDFEESGYGRGAPPKDPAIYSVFAIAVDFLLQDRDIKTLDVFCRNIGNGQELPEAFENAFGIPLDKFYEEFEIYIKTKGVQLPPPGSYQPHDYSYSQG